MKRIFRYVLVGAIAVNALPNPLDAQILIRRPIFNSPLTYVMNKAATSSWWNIDLFCQLYSCSPAYIIDTLYNIYHVLDVYVDPCWNRLVYMDQTDGGVSRLRDYGRFGCGIDSLIEPTAVKVVSQTSDANWYSPTYDIYVADRQNHRVQQLRYRWTTPDSGLITDTCTVSHYGSVAPYGSGLFRRPEFRYTL